LSQVPGDAPQSGSPESRTETSYFPPLDSTEPAAKFERGIIPLPYSFVYAIRDWGEPRWKQSLGLLFVPALIAVLAIEYLLHAATTTIWLSVVGFSVAYAVVALLIYRK
jgi:hypothetical protein